MGDFMIYEHDLTDFQNDFIDALESAVCSPEFGSLVAPRSERVLFVPDSDFGETMIFDFLDPDDLPF